MGDTSKGKNKIGKETVKTFADTKIDKSNDTRNGRTKMEKFGGRPFRLLDAEYLDEPSTKIRAADGQHKATAGEKTARKALNPMKKSAGILKGK